MDKIINVEEILKKHLEKIGISSMKGSDMDNCYKAAIKEIAEAIVDKCAEKAKEKRGRYQHYVVDKDSILQVKTMIQY